ncbi:hypothetical protein L195_g030609 [Trifolium pratense]|uniref:Uncharacterized protein n=1 Tax=Trifolium pratense TaxID=57577 RepID=A0A2K3L852_TRIPR|nr:hypothetical protein L195_g030609 [Trifolium pratense]
MLDSTYLVNRMGSRIYSPQRCAKTLDVINGHQVTAEKRLESLDEQLKLLIIPVEFDITGGLGM